MLVMQLIISTMSLILLKNKELQRTNSLQGAQEKLLFLNSAIEWVRIFLVMQ